MVRLTFRGDTAKNGEGFCFVLLDGVALLVVVAWAWDAAIVGNSLFVVNSIISISTGSERKLASSVVRSVRFFKVTWKLVGTGFRHFVSFVTGEVWRTGAYTEGDFSCR